MEEFWAKRECDVGHDVILFRMKEEEECTTARDATVEGKTRQEHEVGQKKIRRGSDFGGGCLLERGRGKGGPQ